MNRGHHMQSNANLWCILRTAAPRTIALYRSLLGAGYETWTPIETINRRRPRSRTQDELETPILPTFLFARAAHLPDLMAIPALAFNPHPSFSLFRYDGRIPLVADREIEGLRKFEDRARIAHVKSQGRTFKRGEHVRVEEGAFMGMSGVVENGDGKFAMVAFAGSMRVKIATWLLNADGVNACTSLMGAAA